MPVIVLSCGWLKGVHSLASIGKTIIHHQMTLWLRLNVDVKIVRERQQLFLEAMASNYRTVMMFLRVGIFEQYVNSNNTQTCNLGV